MNIAKHLFWLSGFLGFCAVVIVLALPNLALARKFEDLKPTQIKYEKQINLKISSDAVNRINFDNYRVVKIVGNISNFNNILSDNGSDLFITSKVPAGETIDFSALLATGDIIDFSLKVEESKIPSIIKLKFSEEFASNNMAPANQMIKAMINGSASKFYVQKTKKKININISSNINSKIGSKSKQGRKNIQTIRATAEDSYRFANLNGTILILRNTNRSESLKITADDIAANFRDVVAIHIEKDLLSPNGQTKAYVVFKGEEA